MKKVILFIAIFVLGAISYSLLTQFFASPKIETTLSQAPATSTVPQTEPSAEIQEEEEAAEVENTTSLAADGSLLDGPFPLLDQDGKETGATVQIVRSPEETLLQFDDFSLDHSLASRIYFSNDLDATEYFNLAPAAMNDEVFVYGVPLDADLSSFKYILIYDVQMEEAEYYAQIQ